MTDEFTPPARDFAAFIEAAKTGDLAAIDGFLARFPKAIDSFDTNGNTALYTAAYSNRLKAVERLVAAGADLEAFKGYSKSPLAIAAWRGNFEVLKFLHGKGADINSRDDGKCTPLMHAARYGRREIINYLLKEGADLLARDHRGQSAAEVAKDAGQFDTAKFLEPLIRQAEGGALADAFKEGSGEKIRIMSPAKLKPAHKP